MKKITIYSTLLITIVSLFAFKNSILNSELIKVQGGTFKMGSKDSDGIADVDEQKEHDVNLTAFEISKFEVTVWEWQQFIKANKMKMPAKPSWGWQENHPINGITWNEAIAYCNWLSKKEKLQPAYSKKGPNFICDFKANGYRLPTEAEWEFAAKGGTLPKGFKYSGRDSLDDIAWHKGNSAGTPHTIGTKLPNELGLYDMSGNVWEWCWDWYNKDFYKLEKGDNPRGPEMGNRRSVRGGSWDSQANYVRAANRISTEPNKTHEFYGFRVARSIVK